MLLCVKQLESTICGCPWYFLRCLYLKRLIFLIKHSLPSELLYKKNVLFFLHRLRFTDFLFHPFSMKTFNDGIPPGSKCMVFHKER